MSKGSLVHIGTSGWHYDHWKGPFYPDGTAPGDLFFHYCRSFRTVEINSSFYRLPERKTLQQWRDAAPKGFLFAVKASRYITHMKKLKDARAPLRSFLRRIEVLRERLGPILFQLPPRWNFDAQRLKTFLAWLPKEHRYAFEFRDPRWFNDEACDALAGHGAAFCIYDLDGALSPKTVTADFVYIRLHGPEVAYRGSYDTPALSGWAGAISSWTRGRREVFCYFDNDEKGYAALDALRLQEMTGADG